MDRTRHFGRSILAALGGLTLALTIAAAPAAASTVDGSCCVAIASSAWTPTNVSGPVSDSHLNTSHNAGLAYWHSRGVYPCTNTYRLADFGHFRALAVTQNLGCTTYINRTYWANYVWGRLSTGYTGTLAERKMCKVVTHEQGHSAGRPHTSTPNTTMYPYVDQMPLSLNCGLAWQ